MNSYIRDATATIKRFVTMRQAAEHFGLEFNHSGFARCPFHSERTASFAIKNERGHCFGCGWHGDIFDFTARLFSTDLKGAVERLAVDFHLPVSLDRKPSLKERQDASRRYAEITRKRKEETETEEAANAEYHLALDIFCLYDSWKKTYKPQAPTEPFDPRYVEACRHLEQARYESTMKG